MFKDLSLHYRLHVTFGEITFVILYLLLCSYKEAVCLECGFSTGLMPPSNLNVSSEILMFDILPVT